MNQEGKTIVLTIDLDLLYFGQCGAARMAVPGNNQTLIKSKLKF